VVDFFGPTELFTMQKQTVIPGPIQHDAPGSPESKLIGATVGENQAKADQASPITYVSKGDAPILIMHGDHDPLVPVKQSEEFHAKLKKAGVDSTLHIERGAGHSLPGAHIEAKVEAFLARHLKPLPKE
jgi:dipeptidyl aminopeptidase/acylaminoacyl peptidase